MRFRTLVFGSALLSAFAAASPLLAQRNSYDWTDECERQGRRERARACEIRESGIAVRAGAGGTLVLDGGANDAVSVTGWNRDSIHVVARIQARGDTPEDAQANAEHIRIVVTATDIHAEGDRSASWGVTFEVRVPLKSNLEITTRNGPIEVENVTGSMRLEAQNGPIALYGVGGDVRARAQNGPLHVELAGARWEGAGLDAQTINGPVDLSIPANYSAHLETGTTNGPFDVDFPVTVTIRGRLNRISTELGSGGAPVRVITTNGPVQVRRG